MLFKPEMGMIYDSIFFCIEYFNEAEVEQVFKHLFSDTSFMFELYNELSETVSSFPTIISPFFYYVNSAPSPLSSLFVDFNYEFANIEEFISTIQNHSDILYQKTVDSIFQNDNDKRIIPEKTPAAYIEAVYALDVSSEFKLEVSLLLSNFAFGVSQLIDTLRLVYSQITLMHQKYSNKIDNEYSNIVSNNKVKLYHEFFSFDEQSEVNNVSISLLNQYIMLYQNNDGNVTLLLGLQHEEGLADKFNEKNVTAKSFLTVIGHEIRIEIIMALIEKNALTTSQLSKILNRPVTTVIKHVEVLHSHNIIYISSRNGLKIYYKLNASHFEKAKYSVNELFNKVITLKGEKNE